MIGRVVPEAVHHRQRNAGKQEDVRKHRVREAVDQFRVGDRGQVGIGRLFEHATEHLGHDAARGAAFLEREFGVTERAAVAERELVEDVLLAVLAIQRSEEHTSELQSLMRNSYAVFCLNKKKNTIHQQHKPTSSFETRYPTYLC